MKKIIILVLYIFLLTGCSSYVELNDLAIIHEVGIEKDNDTFTFYAKIIDEVDENTRTPTTKIYKVKGNSLNEIIEKLNLELNKKIYISHLDLLLINDTIKTLELKEIINYFLNNNETREDFLVAYSDTLEKTLKESKFQEINDLIQFNHQDTSQSIYTTMNDIIKNYYEQKEIYLTNITYQDHASILGLKKLYHNTYETISLDKSLFINYLLNQVNTYKYTFECESGKYLYLNILRSNTRKIKNQLTITNEIKVITNDCHYKKNKIDEIFTNHLKENLNIETNQKLTINNTIRGYDEK